MKAVIARYSTPNKYDQADKGTICQVYNEDNKMNSDGELYESYIQRSDDSEKPKWEKI